MKFILLVCLLQNIKKNHDFPPIDSGFVFSQESNCTRVHLKQDCDHLTQMVLVHLLFWSAPECERGKRENAPGFNLNRINVTELLVVLSI